MKRKINLRAGQVINLPGHGRHTMKLVAPPAYSTYNKSQETFWWLASPQDVRERVALLPAWEAAGFSQSGITDDNALGYLRQDGSVWVFAFCEGMLVRQSHVTAPGMQAHQFMGDWFDRLTPLPDGRRLDQPAGLVLEKTELNGETLFTIDPDWDNEAAGQVPGLPGGR